MTTVIKLTRAAKGTSIYYVAGHPNIMVTKHSGRSWSGSVGSYAFVDWQAFDTTKENMNEVAIKMADGSMKRLPLMIAKRSSLAKLKTALAKILA